MSSKEPEREGLGSGEEGEEKKADGHEGKAGTFLFGREPNVGMMKAHRMPDRCQQQEGQPDQEGEAG